MDVNHKSRRDMCEALGVSYSTFTCWVTGQKYPRIDKIEALAKYFGIQKADLIEKEQTEEQGAANETLENIIARLRMNADFRRTVEAVNALDAEKLNGLQQMLLAFMK